MEPSRKLRNLGIIAHVDAGKTTLSEALLVKCGAIAVAGTVDDGQATMDFLREEQRRGITIRSAVASFGWKGLRINLVDTPGHVDFGLEVVRSLRVLDGAVAVFCGVRGVEPRSLAVWREADNFRLPRVAFANKLDVPGADFERLLAQMRESFVQTPVPVLWPVLVDGGLEGWVDLVEWKAVRLRGTTTIPLPEIPRAWIEAATPWREGLWDAASLYEESLTETVISGELPSPKILREGLRNGCRAGKLVPVCAGSALMGVGVETLLDAVGHYLPPPSVPEAWKEHPGLGLLVRSHETESGTYMALVRAWSGSFAPGRTILRGGGGKGTIAGIWSVFADELRPQETLEAGEIAAVELAGDWRAGDTVLADEPQVVLEARESHQPVLETLLEACDAQDSVRLEDALSRMVREDGALLADRDPQTGSWRLQGVGELQLDVALSRLREEFGCVFRARPPRAVRRERISRPSGRLENRLELEGVVVDAWCEVVPAPSGNQVRGVFAAADEVQAAVMRAAVEEACQVGACGVGSLEGTNWTMGFDLEAPEPRRALHLVKRCLDRLCREALAAAGVHVEEPLFRVIVHAPHEAVGNVLHELQSRGAKILNIEAKSTGSTIVANSLLSSLLGLAILLRSLSKGQAETTLEPLEWVDASESRQAPRSETPSNNDI
jgi:elongation factor G